MAASVEHVQAELTCLDDLSVMLNARVGANWPPGEYDRPAQEFFLDCMQKGGELAQGVFVWYAITNQAPATLVGAAGFDGLPNPQGEIEIGFSIVDEWQNVGYATEVATALIDKAFSDSRVSKVIAHTTADNSSSCKVLEKLGLSQMSHAQETAMIRFELARK